ncbi:GNAT family N-acetyltransferase [Leisingera methylohalidivorans]|uniref:Acetyltransferase n=1 Tax=Leisingera methylohalidivorans DSM 14336 TaxID=999552 RepID=V9VSN9_9RHOB|nr:GNAT family N-acetyltransferase [Leisingera methylohalidivorans]AHC99876.1 acetyltransferase [Leisingera methylohalidivorans DSM 14336]
MNIASECRLRRAAERDYGGLLRLYRELMGDLPVLAGVEGAAMLRRILQHPGTSIAVAEAEGQVVSTATLHVLPNLTHGGRPYALIENVVTLRAFQGRGLGRAVMTFARDAAWAQDAYKIMLLTGSAAAARGFYERLGYSGDDKHAMTLRRSPARKPPPGNLPQ